MTATELVQVQESLLQEWDLGRGSGGDPGSLPERSCGNPGVSPKNLQYGERKREKSSVVVQVVQVRVTGFVRSELMWIWSEGPEVDRCKTECSIETQRE